MVGPLVKGSTLLKWKKQGKTVITAEPIKAGALYYHRGNGYYSKYLPSRDRKHKESKRLRARKKKQDWIPGEVGEGKYRHTHDNTYNELVKMKTSAWLKKVSKKKTKKKKKK